MTVQPGSNTVVIGASGRGGGGGGTSMRSVCDLMVDDQATPFLKHASELLGYMPVEGLGTVPSDFIVTRVVRAAPHVVLRMEPSPAFILWLAEQVARMQKDGDHRPAD